MPTGKTLRKSSAFRVGLAIAGLLCVAGAILAVHYRAQAAPVLTTDKDDYFASEIVTVTGTGFAADTDYDIPVIRPDGTIVKGTAVTSPAGTQFTATTPALSSTTTSSMASKGPTR